MNQHWIKVNGRAYNLNKVYIAYIQKSDFKDDYYIYLATFEDVDTTRVNKQQTLQFIDTFNQLTGVKLELPK